jgi:methyl-accepting chemotaxis protein
MSTESVKYVVTADTRNAQKGLENLQKGFLKNEETLRNIRNVSAVAFAGVTAGIIATTKKASDLGESINAVSVVFGDGADAIVEFGKSAADAVGLSARAFNELSTETGTLLKATGKPIEEVADQTIELTKRASDLASVFNKDVDQAMSAINQAIRGETEAIRQFGSDVTDASLQQFALAEGIQTAVKDMTQQEKTLLRVQKIMADTNQVQGDFANTSDSLANQQRRLASNVENISATIGTLFIPILEQLTGIVASVASKIGAFAEKYPRLTKVVTLATFAITGIIAVITTLTLAMPILTAVTTAFGVAVNILFSPVTLIILAIGALIAIVVLLVKHWDVVKEVTIKTWEKIKQFVIDATAAI